ncbi:MAG TPA: acyltransferase [Victivallales bacterium]|nr:acyltransferase [Victivallales bacterium]
MYSIYETHFICRPEISEDFIRPYIIDNNGILKGTDEIPEYLRQHGISVGENCNFAGIPRISFCHLRDTDNYEEESRKQLYNIEDFEGAIKIGSNVLLDSSFNPGFTNQPVKFSCLKCNSGLSGRIELGCNCHLNGTSIISYSSVRIEDNVNLGPMVTIMDSSGHSAQKRHEFGEVASIKSDPVVIKEGAWIGTGVTILKGVTIGYSSVIGTNSVVYESIPDNCIALGNPAKVVKKLK